MLKRFVIKKLFDGMEGFHDPDDYWGGNKTRKQRISKLRKTRSKPQASIALCNIANNKNKHKD